MASDDSSANVDSRFRGLRARESEAYRRLAVGAMADILAAHEMDSPERVAEQKRQAAKGRKRKARAKACLRHKSNLLKLRFGC